MPGGWRGCARPGGFLIAALGLCPATSCLVGHCFPSPFGALGVPFCCRSWCGRLRSFRPTGSCGKPAPPRRRFPCSESPPPGRGVPSPPAARWRRDCFRRHPLSAEGNSLPGGVKRSPRRRRVRGGDNDVHDVLRRGVAGGERGGRTGRGRKRTRTSSRKMRTIIRRGKAGGRPWAAYRPGKTTGK